jgi:TonB family protein
MTAAPVLTPEFHAPPPVEQPKRLREPVHTGVLSASVAPPVTKRPLPKVQTGGFGDPHGVSAAATPHRGMAVATVGSFGSPVGPGSGNGTGGRRGARGEIAQAGFGDAAASPAQSGTARHGAGVRAGVFSDQAAVPATSAPAPPAAKPSVQPVEILAKPDPVYTAEARAHKIEGNVLLEVIFAANGKVEVLRVLEGLGYGLDQAAISAARRIRFRPERDNGKPVDARARLRIVFRLAY